MPPDADLAGSLAETLGVRDLPAAFERFRLVLASGVSRPAQPEEWTGCLVLVERGTVEVDCGIAGSRSFRTGDMVALDWLPIRTLRNPGTAEACLLAVRRRGNPSPSQHRRRPPASDREVGRDPSPGPATVTPVPVGDCQDRPIRSSPMTNGVRCR